jgi:hypothetical protein
VASSIRGTGAQKCRAIGISGWTWLFHNGVRAEFVEPTGGLNGRQAAQRAASELSGCARGTAVSIANAVNSVGRPARV